MLSRLRAALVALALSAAVLMPVAGCGAVAGSGREEPTPTPIPPPPVPEKPTYTVRRGEVIDSLSFTGRVSPSIERELFFRTNGRVKRVYVERNEMVAEGDVLAELENDDLLRQLAQTEIELDTARRNFERAIASREEEVARAELALEIRRLELQRAEQEARTAVDVISARAALDRLLAGPTEEELEIARRRIDQAKNSLWAAQNVRDATCGGDPAGAACRQAEANVLNAEENVGIAEIQYQQMYQGPSEHDLAVAQANYNRAVERQRQAEMDLEIQRKQLELAEMELERMREEIDPNLTNAVERAELQVERLKNQVEDTQIISPIDGKVTSVGAYEGREVQAYRAVFVVADETELKITAEPMSTQLQRMSEGMPVVVMLSAYPGKELHGEIVQLPYPYGRGGSATEAASLEQTDRLTHIEFDPEDLDLEPGDLVRVLVTIEQKSDALWLPPAAIRTFAGRKFVVVEEEGRQRRVDVTTGIESAERVEILEGLEEGQIVVGP